MADKPDTLPEPDFTIQVNDEPDIPVYTASTLREAIKGANYALLMRLHEEHKHQHNHFHCAAVKLMEDEQ